VKSLRIIQKTQRDSRCRKYRIYLHHPYRCSKRCMCL